MNDLLLTKYQAALVSELVCPYCKGKLIDLAKRRSHCFHCQAHFFGEVANG